MSITPPPPVHGPTQPSPSPEPDRDLVGRIGWDLSPLDTRAHAVDPLDQRYTGVYVALCGAKMLAGGLHRLPHGGLCVGCAQRSPPASSGPAG